MKPELAQAAVEMYDSLRTSIDHAGGSGNSFTPDKLKNMTVMELISELASNNIRFTCTKKVPRKDEALLSDEEDYEGVSR